ncbi:hypothetical protein RP726_06120 [Candidatus Methylospira mobilis]|nr:hypothetical protein [Candidatus Methylospira mobilis]WNV05988.1 hypothetical protein RP726_06120 [Candidatus Methylospira mobilis]
MAASGQYSGVGSALTGVFQFGCAFLVSSLVAAGQNGTSLPDDYCCCGFRHAG